MLIKNPMQLQIELYGRLTLALEGTMLRLLYKLEEIIEEQVYSYPETWGGRTGEFKDSFNFSMPEIAMGMVQSVLSQEGFSFSYDGDSWKHGNKWSPIDINVLNNVIEHGLNESHFGFPAIEKREFWSTFKSWVELSLDDIFMTECIRVGLPIQYPTRVWGG